MSFPNAETAQLMYAYCAQHYYWEAIESILVKYLGCEIKDIEYNDQLQVLLKLTNENIIILVEYYKDTPNKYHTLQIVMKTKTPNGVSTIGLDVLRWNNNDHDTLSTEESGYKVINEIVNLLEPICISSN